MGPLIGANIFAYFIQGRFAPPHDIPGAPFYSSAVLSAIGLAIALWAEHEVPSSAASEPELQAVRTAEGKPG